MDIWDYFERHQRECRSLGLVESDNFPIQYFAMEGRNDMRGLILGRYDLGDRAFVGVKEVVEIVEGNYPQRVQYAYYLIVDGFEEFARERDPSHHPAVHGHGRGHRWEPAEPITFVRFVNEAWDRVSDLPDESLADESLGGGIAP